MNNCPRFVTNGTILPNAFHISPVWWSTPAVHNIEGPELIKVVGVQSIPVLDDLVLIVGPVAFPKGLRAT